LRREITPVFFMRMRFDALVMSLLASWLELMGDQSSQHTTRPSPL